MFVVTQASIYIENFEKGKKLLQERKYNEASICFEKVIAELKKKQSLALTNNEIISLLASIYHQLGNLNVNYVASEAEKLHHNNYFIS